MEENKQPFQRIMLYYFNKGKNAKKWFAKFRAGDFSLDDAPQSGRPVEVGSDQIETLIENNQCSTTWERVDILKITNEVTGENEKRVMSFT